MDNPFTHRNIVGDYMNYSKYPTNENVQIIYNESGDTLQHLIEKAFRQYLKVGSYSLNKGELKK